MMKYKVGDLVEFRYSSGIFGIGKIVETNSGSCKDIYLIELPKELHGEGHTGNGRSHKTYDKDNYWFIDDMDIIRKVGSTVFTKADLKAGMLVEYRNGNLRFVMDSKEGLYLTSNRVYNFLRNYDDNLLDVEGATGLDIVKVYDLVNDSYRVLEDLLKVEYRKLLWERVEPAEEPVEEMTLEEVCKALGKNIKVVKG